MARASSLRNNCRPSDADTSRTPLAANLASVSAVTMPAPVEVGPLHSVETTPPAGLTACWVESGRFGSFTASSLVVRHPEGTVAHLLANPEQLKKVLLLHVVSGKVAAADVVKLHEAESLNGEKLTIDTKDGVKIDGAKVVQTDIEASNGIVHVIDTVLIPENL